MSISPPAARRSQRDRKSVKHFESSAVSGSVPRKRKRNDADADAGGDQVGSQQRALTDDEQEADMDQDAEDEADEEGADESEVDEEEDDRRGGHPSTDEDEYKGARTSLSGKKGKTTRSSKPGATAPPPSKKIRKPKTASKPGKPAPATTRRRKPKERKKEGGAVTSQGDVSAKDANIAKDNALFNALVNPSVALQSTAEDFFESLQTNAGTAQAELVNLILRCCGSNDSVDADEAVDYDGVVDALDNFTEGLKQENSPIYPLTSKLPALKKFRKHLAEFIDRLITAAAELGLLYSTDLMATIQTWVVAMSSSQIRSFRHTATVIALELETALCDVAAAVEKEAEVVSRQREGEKKRKATNKSAGVARLKELELKAKGIRKRRDQVLEFLKEIVDGVFIHRYRDLDPNIRAECVRAIGLWFKKHPSHFLDTAYLRYVGWVLSDISNHVRLEAVRALSNVYDQPDFISSLNTFTERFRSRLIEMATLDVDVSVRVAVVHVLASIDGYSLLEDEEREKLCLLVFDEEPRVRRAVAGFVRGVWSEAVDERSAGRKSGKKKMALKDKERVEIKAFVALLVQWGRTLDKMIGDDTDSELADTSDDGHQSAGDAHRARLRRQTKQRKELVALVGEGVGRTALAVEALWAEVEPVSDWEGLLEMLLLDHSAAANGMDVDEDEMPERVGPARRGHGNGKRRQTEETEEIENEMENGESEERVAVVIDDAWRLEEVEEGTLLEVLVATVRKAKAEAVGGKKGEEETVVSDITRALIKGLPRLFIKHRADSKRVAEVLQLPTLMNLDLYLEMRMITSYASLWDDITKQFLSHSSLTVLARAVSAIRCLLDATSLSNTNATKMAELEEELSSTLHDAVGGREEIEVATFTEDEAITLGAICSRLAVLFGNRNMTAWMEEDEGGKQSSAWDIVSALSERGRLGYREEEMMVEQALQALSLHIMWKATGLTATEDPPPEEAKFRMKLVEQRGGLLEKLVEYAIGGRSNAVENVKRSAFKNMLDLHVLFSPVNAVDADGGLLPTAIVPLTLDDEVQYRCAGFMQAEIERYAELVTEDEEKEKPPIDKDRGSGSGSEEEEEEAAKKVQQPQKKSQSGKKQQAAKTVKGAEKQKTSEVLSRAELEQEYLFIDVVSTYIRAIRAGAIHPRHGAVLLAHYGRLGSAFDACTKVIIDVLREEGMMYGNGDIVVTVVTQAMQEAFNLVLDGVVRGEDNVIQLAKALSACLAIRGSQLSIVKRLESQYVVQIHMTLINYIVKKLVGYEKNKNKRLFKVAISFFRILIHMLLGVQSKEAQDIKAHTEQSLAQAKLDVSPTSKAWEPQRAYEKRLSTAMSKVKSAGAKSRKGKGAAGVTDESEVEKTGTEDEVIEGRVSPPPPLPQPKPRRATRAHPDVHDSHAEVTEAGVHDGDGDNPFANGARARAEDDDDDFDPITPKKLVAQKSAYRTRTPAKSVSPPLTDLTHDMDGMEENVPRQLSQALSPLTTSHDGDADDGGLLLVTPAPSRKRPRPDDDDQPEQGTADVTLAPEEAAILSPVGDLQIRRKRIRH